jgi:hypothetical protein
MSARTELVGLQKPLGKQDKIRRNSMIFVKRMSVLQQHQMVINPVSFSNAYHSTVNKVDNNDSKASKKDRANEK